MSHRAAAPLERGGGGGTEVLVVCHPTLALGRSSKHALHRASRAARSARRLRHAHSPQETTCAVTRRAHVGARARSAHAFGAERVARSGNQAVAGAWAWRVARRGDGSQRLPRPVHKARSALAGPRAQSAGAERERECDAATPNQAPGAQRPRHRRQARGRPGSQAAPPLWPLWAAGPCTDALCLHTLGGFCLLAQLEDCGIL